MKISIPSVTCHDIASVRVSVPVLFGEEDIPNDFPFRSGDMWEITIDADTGKIDKWPAGKAAEVSMKVCDQGSYELRDRNGAIVFSVEHDYVPKFIPGEYGDYVEMTIGEDGTIAEWGRFFTRDRIEAATGKEG